VFLCKSLPPSSINCSKARAYPSGFPSRLHSKGRLLALPANIRLGWKCRWTIFEQISSKKTHSRPTEVSAKLWLRATTSTCPNLSFRTPTPAWISPTTGSTDPSLTRRFRSPAATGFRWSVRRSSRLRRGPEKGAFPVKKGVDFRFIDTARCQRCYHINS
jgi:hypothetical protein